MVGMTGNSAVEKGDVARLPDGPQFFAPLESLRGVAALIVVMYHAVWTNPITGLRFFQNSPLMVDFFFVLSGFVMFHSYGQKLHALTGVFRFLWLRIGRLYPLHLVFVLVFLLFECAKFVAEKRFGIVADKPPFTVNSGYALFTNLLLIHSLGVHNSLTFNYPSWSISTEFYAYVLFAVVRSLLPDLRYFIVAAIVIVIASVATLLDVNVVSLANAGFDWGFFRCCGGFFLGTLVYCIYSHSRAEGCNYARAAGSFWVSPLVFAVTIVVLSSVDPDGRWTYVLPLLSGCVILSIVMVPQPVMQSLLSSRPLTWLGRVSYSLYMVHAAIAWVTTQILTIVLKYPKTVLVDGHGAATPPAVGLGALAVYVSIVLVLSHFTYQLIEEPWRKRSRRLAERWFPDWAVRSSIRVSSTQ
jgi:peptidoglycan/LPS O-acetylase OafA/YrhL